MSVIARSKIALQPSDVIAKELKLLNACLLEKQRVGRPRLMEPKIKKIYKSTPEQKKIYNERYNSKYKTIVSQTKAMHKLLLSNLTDDDIIKYFLIMYPDKPNQIKITHYIRGMYTNLLNFVTTFKIDEGNHLIIDKLLSLNSNDNIKRIIPYILYSYNLPKECIA